MRILLFMALAFLTFTSAPASGSCSGRLDGAPQAGGGEYDPFDALDFRRRQSITVRNTSGEMCDFVVGFKRQPAEGRLAPFLQYRVEDAEGVSLLAEQKPSDGAPHIIVKNVAAYQTASVHYYLVLTRGQFAYPGRYDDNDVTLTLQTRSSSGVIGQAEEDSKILLISQIVRASVNVSIAGGGLTTTLSFGSMSKGQERSIAIQTTANHSYSLVLKSANNSVMKIEPEITGQNWGIPYSLRINSQPTTLTSTVFIPKNVSPLTLGRETHLLTFRIEDILNKRAGFYRDIITLEVSINP